MVVVVVIVLEARVVAMMVGVAERRVVVVLLIGLGVVGVGVAVSPLRRMGSMRLGTMAQHLMHADPGRHHLGRNQGEAEKECRHSAFHGYHDRKSLPIPEGASQAMPAPIT